LPKKWSPLRALTAVHCMQYTCIWKHLTKWSFLHIQNRPVAGRGRYTRVINIQILTIYFSFQHSVTYCSQALRQDNAPVYRARETVRLLTHETPDFITPALWPANSPDLNPVDYPVPYLAEAAGACVPQPYLWRRPDEVAPDRRVGTFPPGGHRWSGQAVASTSSSLCSSTRWTFWTQTLVMLTSCHSHGRTLDSQSRLCL